MRVEEGRTGGEQAVPQLHLRGDLGSSWEHSVELSISSKKIKDGVREPQGVSGLLGCTRLKSTVSVLNSSLREIWASVNRKAVRVG